MNGIQKPEKSSCRHELGPCNITNNNFHNYSAKTHIESLPLFSKTNPRQLLNELVIHKIILHWI